MNYPDYFSYHNGNLLRKSEIKIGLPELSVLRGYGIFDYLCTYQGKPFRFDDYMDRFENSAKLMHLPIPLKRNEILSVLQQLFEKNNVPQNGDVGIRFILTGGNAEDGYSISTPNFLILIEKIPEYPSWQFENGITLNLHEHQRELPLVKTINYITAINLAPLRSKLNAQETLYHSGGNILECCRHNFFIFHGDTLITAKENVLKGITAKVMMELAQPFFKVEQRELKLEELQSATECLISGSTRGPCPVIQIDQKQIANGKPGINTRKLIELFKAETKK